MKHSIIVVEDEKIVRISLADALTAEGYTVLAVPTCAEALAALGEGAFSLVITDVRLPDGNGIEILQRIMERGDNSSVIVMTAFGTIEDAVKAMRLGAYNYITKPFSLEAMLLVVKRALDHQDAAATNVRLRKELSSCYCPFPNMIGESSAMHKVFSLLARVARTDSTVLITGESGTGKELVASSIHYQSDRKDKPLVRVNCAALPDTLIEAELFGHEKGAFTGAEVRKLGRFELADGGTIFLDEIGDLPLLTQTKILRVIEERTLERLGGGANTLKVDVRVLAATNKELAEEVRQGRFREDLFYRLNVIPVEMPPLRKRSEDIPLLVEKFAKRCNDRFGTTRSFDPQAIEALMRYSFPGNVRELQNIVERCIALTETEIIGRADLPAHIRGDMGRQSALLPLAEVVGEAERAHIEKILRITSGNRSKAADLLGISRKTLWEKINSHKLKV
ncbi:sigma-54-dependent transcriptional regulator [Desulfurivibrio sp. D14AmB]|uniref:sigma-54-dependent transcriptional regulator n=1 Tax=Desulfurivibrio sp. D14AmB TaxID=3374370 RepID=UPI00376ED1DE